MSNVKKTTLLKFLHYYYVLMFSIFFQKIEIQPVRLLRVYVSPTNMHEKNQSINEKFEHSITF